MCGVGQSPKWKISQLITIQRLFKGNTIVISRKAKAHKIVCVTIALSRLDAINEMPWHTSDGTGHAFSTCVLYTRGNVPKPLSQRKHATRCMYGVSTASLYIGTQPNLRLSESEWKFVEPALSFSSKQYTLDSAVPSNVLIKGIRTA